jgi:hypothetical protein
MKHCIGKLPVKATEISSAANVGRSTCIICALYDTRIDSNCQAVKSRSAHTRGCVPVVDVHPSIVRACASTIIRCDRPVVRVRLQLALRCCDALRVVCTITNHSTTLSQCICRATAHYK